MQLEITRLAPGDQQVGVDWLFLDEKPTYSHFVVEYRMRDAQWETAQSVELPKDFFSVQLTGLQNAVDYEVRVIARDGVGDVVATSAPRLVRSGPVPGVVVNYIHPDDYTYNSSGRSTASPSIAKLPDGRLVASHDIYWGKHGQDLSMVFRSDDGGASWYFLSKLHPCFWGKLFVHQRALYMLSTSTEYGALLIRKSLDGGESWSEPTTILPSGSREAGGPHKAPMPVIEHYGRLWSAVEHGSWGLGGHAAGVVSAPVAANLLEAASWSVTPFLPYDAAWEGTVKGGVKPGVLEGNVVVTPQGELVNILRYNTKGGDPEYGKAIILNVDADNPTAPLTFRQVVDFHGNMPKFGIYFDPVSKRYWSLVNPVTTTNVQQRNILTLVSSTDLMRWEIVKEILNYQDNGWPEDSTKVGFQYVDWLFDGEDIVLLSRTAINGAYNYHNANHITFHRIKGFRSLSSVKEMA